MHTKHIAFATLGLIATSLLVYALWQRDADTEAASVDAQAKPVASARSAPTDTDADHGAAHTADDGHGHDHGEEAPNVDLRALYFQPPALADGTRFAEVETPLLVEVSCRAQPLLARGGSAESRLRTLFAMEPSERFPRDLFYRSMIQFWREGDAYYQLSAIWDIGIPPVYRLALHRSPVADFSRDVRETPLPGRVPDVIDAQAAADYMAQTTDGAVARGGQLGLQLTEAEWPTPDGRGRMRTTLANGRAMGWSFPGGHCGWDAEAASLRCRCPSGSGRPPDEGEQPGTS